MAAAWLLEVHGIIKVAWTTIEDGNLLLYF